MFYREKVKGFEREDLTFNSALEAAWIEPEISSQKILFSSIYRQPDDMQFFDKLQKKLEPLCQRRSNLLILGDLNADLHFQRGIQKDMRTGKMLLRESKSFNLHNALLQRTKNCMSSGCL